MQNFFHRIIFEREKPSKKIINVINAVTLFIFAIV